MASKLFVKICGITNRHDARAAVEAGADALGLNFYDKSPRCVSTHIAAEIVGSVPPSVWTVGVFVDEQRDRIAEIATAVGLTGLQFHGQEHPDACSGWPGLKIIKAVRVRDASAVSLAQSYAVDFILADAYVEGQAGGTGRRVATDLLVGFDARRLIVAGGLTAETVGDVVRAARPFGVDVASGVESAPARKDPELMRRFIANARAA